MIECITWENREMFDFTSTADTLPAPPVLMDISTCIQEDGQGLLQKYLSLIPRMTAWPKMVLMNLMFKMILRTRTVECLSDLINIFKRNPKQFFDTIGPCPMADTTTDNLEESFQCYFNKWILGLLQDHGYHNPHHAEELERIITRLDSPEDLPFFLQQLETNLNRNINMSGWLNDVWRISHRAA